MQIPLVMTIIGPDRTGLVEAVARAVAGHGTGNRLNQAGAIRTDNGHHQRNLHGNKIMAGWLFSAS